MQYMLNLWNTCLILIFGLAVDEKKIPTTGWKIFFQTSRDITTFSCNKQFQAWLDNEGAVQYFSRYSKVLDIKIASFDVVVAIEKF